MQLGIGRGDSSRRVLGKKPVTVAELETSIKDFRDLASGNEIDYDGRKARLIWATGGVPPVWVAPPLAGEPPALAAPPAAAPPVALPDTAPADPPVALPDTAPLPSPAAAPSGFCCEVCPPQAAPAPAAIAKNAQCPNGCQQRRCALCMG